MRRDEAKLDAIIANLEYFVELEEEALSLASHHSCLHVASQFL
jgi:hypothetical protein